MRKNNKTNFNLNAVNKKKNRFVFKYYNRLVYLTKIHQNNTIMVKTYSKHIAPNHVTLTYIIDCLINLKKNCLDKIRILPPKLKINN